MARMAGRAAVVPRMQVLHKKTLKYTTSARCLHVRAATECLFTAWRQPGPPQAAPL